MADTGPWAKIALVDSVPRGTDAKGEFRIQSASARRALRLGAQKQGNYPEKGVTVAPQSSDVHLVLRTGAIIEATVLLTDGAPLDALEEYFLPERGIGVSAKLETGGTVPQRRPGWRG